MSDANKNPEQIARDAIDARLAASGWGVQDNKKWTATLSAPGNLAAQEWDEV